MAKAQVFRLTDFSGGYNPDVSPHAIQDNQAVEILNFRLDELGTLVSRQGVQEWVTSGSSPFNGISAFISPDAPNDSQVVVAMDRTDTEDGGDLFSSSDGSDWYVRGKYAQEGQPVGTPRFLAAQNKLFVVSGKNPPVVLDFNPSPLRALGVPAPLAAPTAVASSGGSLTVGAYQYVYTVTRDGFESNPSPAVSVSTSGGNLSVTLTLPAAAAGTTRSVYRTDVNSMSNVFKLLGNFGTSTSIVDDGTTATSDLAPPADHDAPPNLEHIAYYNGRYFGAIGDKIYWSYPLNAEYWPALNVTTIPFQGNDKVQALLSFQDSLLIFGRRNCLLLTGAQDDNSTMGSWQITRLDVEIGLASPDAVTDLGGQALFLSDDGLRVYPGFQVVAPQIQRELTTTNYTAKGAARLAHVPEERSAWLTVGDKTYVIHLPNQAVSFYDIYPDHMLSGGRRGNDPLLFTVGNSIYQYGPAELDEGNTPIPVRWRSKMFQIGMPESVKYFRRIGAFATKGAGAGVTITLRDRGQMFTVQMAQVSGADESRWNDFNWNEATWAGSGLAYFIAALPAQRLSGRSMEIEIRAEVSRRTEVAPPISLLYREANRFLGV